MSFFSRIKINLKKTRSKFTGRLKKSILSRNRISDDLIEELEEILIEGDVGLDMTNRLLDALRKRVKAEKPTTPEGILDCLKAEMVAVINTENDAGPEPVVKPRVVMVVGVNGVGKTTTIGKMAHRAAVSGQKVLIAAADTFRAAAFEQVEIWAERAGVSIVKSHKGSDPAAVAYDAISSAMAKGVDLVIVDTAGRLHTRVNLMEELRKIKRVMGKNLDGAPHDILLVLDATTGQNGIQQAKVFHEKIGLTGVALTKLDGTARGGVILRVKEELGVPVTLVGVGEQLDDLHPFDAREYIDALFD